jgi:hypothetical protein
MQRPHVTAVGEDRLAAFAAPRIKPSLSIFHALTKAAVPWIQPL